MWIFENRGFLNMNWQEITALFILLLSPEAAVIMWYQAGTSIWIAYTITVFITSLGIAAVFCGAGFLREHGFWRNASQLISSVFQKIPAIRFFLEGEDKLENQAVGWLVHRRAIVIFILALLPVPILPAAITVAVRLMNIRHGLFFLLTINAIRGFLFALGVYYGVNLVR